MYDKKRLTLLTIAKYATTLCYDYEYLYSQKEKEEFLKLYSDFMKSLLLELGEEDEE